LFAGSRFRLGIGQSIFTRCGRLLAPPVVNSKPLQPAFFMPCA
jgi:hypothetical protein